MEREAFASLFLFIYLKPWGFAKKKMGWAWVMSNFGIGIVGRDLQIP